MRSVRLIPCLDVTVGRVVKGVQFVDLTDEGDPVELAARYGNGKGPTRSPSSTSQRRPTGATPWCPSSPVPLSRSSSRSPSAAGCGRVTTPAVCCGPEPTR